MNMKLATTALGSLGAYISANFGPSFVVVVAGAAFGVFAAVGLDDEVQPTMRQLLRAVSTWVTAVLLVTFAPAVVDAKWLNGGVEFGLAGIVALLGYFWIQDIIKSGKRFWSELKIADWLPWRKNK